MQLMSLKLYWKNLVWKNWFIFVCFSWWNHSSFFCLRPEWREWCFCCLAKLAHQLVLLWAGDGLRFDGSVSTPSGGATRLKSPWFSLGYIGMSKTVWKWKLWQWWWQTWSSWWYRACQWWLWLMMMAVMIIMTISSLMLWWWKTCLFDSSSIPSDNY